MNPKVTLTIDSLGDGLKPGELSVVMAASKTGKTMFDRDDTIFRKWLGPIQYPARGLLENERGML
jgi:hypothetical protein